MKTGHTDVFTPNYHGSVTIYQLEDWIQKAWEEQNRSTTLQKVGKLIKHQVSSKDVQIQLDTISKEVRERIGANTEVLLPVKIPGKPEIQKALVDISQLLTIFNLASTWETGRVTSPNSGKSWMRRRLIRSSCLMTSAIHPSQHRL